MLTYAITAGDPLSGFAIDASGNITINDASVLDLDFDDGTDLVATLTVTVSDGTNNDTVDVTVRVTPINDNNPNAGVDFTATVAEESANGTAVGSISATDIDLPGDVLTYAITAGDPLSGFAIDASGNITINDASVLDLDFDDGTDLVATLTVTVSDGTNNDTVDVTVRVTPINDNNPNAGVDFTATVAEESANGTAVGSISATDIDLPGDVLTYAITAGDPLSGFAIDASGNITINDASVLDLDFDDGTDLVATLTVTVSDGTNNDTVDVTVRVTPINDNNPNAGVDFTATVAEESANGTAVGSVSATDIDLPGDVLTYAITAGDPLSGFAIDASGNITINDASVLDLDFDDGTDLVATLTVTVTDGSGGVGTVTVNVTVSPVNEVPLAVTDSYALDEGAALVVTTPGLIANDIDPDGDPLMTSVVMGPTNGLLTLNSDGSFTYTHDGSETTSDSFTYQVDDGNGGVSTGTVILTINPLNDAPVATDDTYTINEGGTLVVAAPGVVSNDTDVEGDALSAVLISGPTNGSLSLNADGSFTYVHDGSETTNDSFIYRTDDGNGGSDTATVNITIDPVNDAPVTSVPTAQTTPEDTPLLFSSGDGNAVTVSDADASGNPIIITIAAANGTVSLGGLTGLTFATGDGLSDSTMTFAGTVSEINTALEGMTFTPSPDFHGLATIDITIDDQGNLGSGGAKLDLDSINITISPVNDQPVANVDVVTVDEGAAVAVTGMGVLANDSDIDGDTLTSNLIGGPAHGSVSLNIDGSFTYTHDGGETTSDSFVYEVSDGNGGVATAVVDIVVNPVNDTPQAVDDNFSVPTSQGIEVFAPGVASNDSDVDDTTLVSVLGTGPDHGTVTLNADGSFLYVPTPGFVGADSFTYWIGDPSGAGDVATVTINVGAPLGPGGFEPTGGSSARMAATKTMKISGPDTSIIQLETELLVDTIESAPNTLSTAPPTRSNARLERNSLDGSRDELREVAHVIASTDQFSSGLVGDRRDLSVQRLDASVDDAVDVQATTAVTQVQGYLKQLDDLADSLRELGDFGIFNGVTLTAAASLATAAYLAWSIRSGYLTASMVASLPAWMRVDPLPVLDFAVAAKSRRKRDEELSLLPSGNI